MLKEREKTLAKYWIAFVVIIWPTMAFLAPNGSLLQAFAGIVSVIGFLAFSVFTTIWAIDTLVRKY